MKKSYIHPFKGFGHVPSKCKVMIFSDDGEYFICFEDIGEGTSVTNASEQLASEIVDKEQLDPVNCRFFEAYIQYDNDSFVFNELNNVFDEILYKWSTVHGRWEAKHPEWKPASKEMKNLFIY